MHRSSSSILVTADPVDRVASWLQRLGAGFDRAAVERLLSLDPQEEAGLMPRLLEAFETSLQAQLSDLQAAVERHDAQACRRAAHSMRSAGNSMGALDFAAACHALELHAHALHQAHPAGAAGAPDLPGLLMQATKLTQQGHHLLAQIRHARHDEPT